MPLQCLVFAVLAVTAALVSSSNADGLKTSAIDLTKKYGSALVRVYATSQLQEQVAGVAQSKKDHTSYCQGTIVDKDGLTIVSRSRFDTSTLMKGTRVNVGGEVQEIDYKSKFKKIELELADGSRVPARVLIVDPVWDIVIVAPKEPLDGNKFTFVPVDSDADKLIAMDELLYLRRMNPLLNNQIAVGFASVSAVIEKPVQMYYINGMRPSSPVFNTKGELVGISALKMPNMNDMISNAEEPRFGVLPCRYLRIVLEQAKKHVE